jgi:hypothetical protein
VIGIFVGIVELPFVFERLECTKGLSVKLKSMNPGLKAILYVAYALSTPFLTLQRINIDILLLWHQQLPGRNSAHPHRLCLRLGLAGPAGACLAKSFSASLQLLS